MAYYHKYSYEIKVQVVKEYIEEGKSVSSLCAAYGMTKRTVKDWIRLYRTFGYSGLRTEDKATKYSNEVKRQAVHDYLSQALSVPEILVKYKIRSKTQLKSWIEQSVGRTGKPQTQTGRSPEEIRIQLSRVRNASIYQTIRKKHEETHYPISRLCREAHVSRAGYYKWLSREIPSSEQENRQIADIILQIHKESPDKGYRRIRDELERYHHIKVNDKRVLRLCRILNIKSGIKYTYDNHTYKKKPYKYTAENILGRNFRAEKPNEKWLTDISEFKYYVKGEKRKLYLSAILDLYDRRIVSYVVSDYNNNELVYTTLDKALEKEPNAHPVMHSDRGVQYTSYDYRQKLIDAGIRQSMSRVGKCIDNGPMEGFWGIIKRERYYGKTYKRRCALVKMIQDYIEYYNHKRLQRNLGVCTPMEKHNDYKHAA